MAMAMALLAVDGQAERYQAAISNDSYMDRGDAMGQARAEARSLISRIFHPSDFSQASEVAFAHAFKLALESKAELAMMHVTRQLAANEADAHWTDFPGVRATLARWGILPLEAEREDVVKAAPGVKKIVNLGWDPVESMLRFCLNYPPDLLVLATHQREGLARWMHKAVAEPLARRSGREP